MKLELNPTAKFKIVDQPYALPSKCSFCGIGHNEDGRRVFIDTTLDLDYYGVVYICSTCFIEVAQSLGFIAPEAWEKVVESSTNSLIENEQLKGENEGLRVAVGALTNHRCFKPFSDSDICDGEGAVEASPVPGNPLEGGKPESSDNAEPDDGKRLPDVRRNAEFNDGDAIATAVERKRPKLAGGRTILDDLA